MPRPIDRHAARLSRLTTEQSELVARREAERLTRSELPGVTRVLAKDLRPGQVVLSDSGYVSGVVSRVDRARQPHYVVVSWADGTRWSGSELQIHRVASTEEVGVHELVEGDVVPSFGASGSTMHVGAVELSERGVNPALPETRLLTVNWLGRGGKFMAVVRGDGTCSERMTRLVRRTRA